MHSDPEQIRLTLSHERLFLPARDPLPAPRTAPILPELRALLSGGRARDAAERITALAEGEGYEGTHWIDPLVGAARVAFTPSRPVAGPVTRSCDLNTGVVTEELPDGTSHRVFVSRADDAVVCELIRSSGLEGTLSLGVLPGSPPVPLLVRTGTGPGRLSLTVAFPGRPEGATAGYSVACGVTPEGGTVRVDGDRLRLRGVRRLALLFRTRVAEPGAERPPAPGPLPEAGTGALWERHRPVHTGLMDRFRMRLGGGSGPERVARLVDAGRYAVVSATGDLPPTLQGALRRWEHSSRVPISSFLILLRGRRPVGPLGPTRPGSPPRG